MKYVLDASVAAWQESCQLVTADDKLINALRGQFPFLRSLASLP